MAEAMWLLPTPGGPKINKFAPWVSQASPAASAETWALDTVVTAAKSKLDRVLLGSSRASSRWRWMRLRSRSALLSGRLAVANGRVPLDLLLVGASGGNGMAQAAMPISHATVNTVFLACRTPGAVLTSCPRLGAG